MTFSGFIKTDLVNYPEKVASTVFTQGCNLSCPYCHNPAFVQGRAMEMYTEDGVLGYLEKHRRLLDGVVVSGGEPTLHKDLPEFLRRVREMGLKTKIDTNGTCPEMVDLLLKDSLVDYIAMDIKTIWEKYPLVGCSDAETVKRTFEIVTSASIPREFRTTCPKGILERNPEHPEKDDFMTIASEIGSNVPWFLQIFNNRGALLDPDFANTPSWSIKELETIVASLKSVKQNVFIRS